MIDRIERAEIEKWLDKMENMMDRIEAADDKSKEVLQNMKAYAQDSRYFLDKQDFVRSFEAIIWAFAIFETCKELNVFAIDEGK